MNKSIQDIHAHVLIWLDEAAHMIRKFVCRTFNDRDKIESQGFSHEY